MNVGEEHKELKNSLKSVKRTLSGKKGITRGIIFSR